MVNHQQLQFQAPANGRLMQLSMHPDEVIRQQLLGPGFLIQLHGNELQSPFTGQLQSASPSGHQWTFLATPKSYQCSFILASPNHMTSLPGLQKLPRLEGKIRAGQRLAKLHLPDIQGSIGHRFLAVLFPQAQSVELDWPATQISLGDQTIVNLSYP